MLENRSSIIRNDDFPCTRLDLLVSLRSSIEARKLTILSIPFGPRLVRTASDTAKRQHFTSPTQYKEESVAHPWRRSYWTT